MARTSVVVTLATVIALPGCGLIKRRQPTGEAPSASASVVAAPPPPVSIAPVASAAPEPVVPTVADDAIAASEDFEDEAFQKVSATNYKAQLAAIQKELSAP